MVSLKGFTRELTKYSTLRYLTERARNLDVAGRANRNILFLYGLREGNIIKPDTRPSTSVAKISDKLSRWEALHPTRWLRRSRPGVRSKNEKMNEDRTDRNNSVFTLYAGRLWSSILRINRGLNENAA